MSTVLPRTNCVLRTISLCDSPLVMLLLAAAGGPTLLACDLGFAPQRAFGLLVQFFGCQQRGGGGGNRKRLFHANRRDIRTNGNLGDSLREYIKRGREQHHHRTARSTENDAGESRK